MEGGLQKEEQCYLTDRRDALSGVNYQLLQGDVACADGGL